MDLRSQDIVSTRLVDCRRSKWPNLNGWLVRGLAGADEVLKNMHQLIHLLSEVRIRIGFCAVGMEHWNWQPYVGFGFNNDLGICRISEMWYHHWYDRSGRWRLSCSHSFFQTPTSKLVKLCIFLKLGSGLCVWDRSSNIWKKETLRYEVSFRQRGERLVARAKCDGVDYLSWEEG